MASDFKRLRTLCEWAQIRPIDRFLEWGFGRENLESMALVDLIEVWNKRHSRHPLEASLSSLALLKILKCAWLEHENQSKQNQQ